MKDEYTPDLITLLDEDNQEHNFEILDIIEDRDSKYYALLPCFDSKEEMLYDRGDYLILEAIDENGEEQLAEIEDGELKYKLQRIFDERFEDMFY